MHIVKCPSGRVAKVTNILADGRECDDMSLITVPYEGFEVIYDHILPSVLKAKHKNVNEYCNSENDELP